MSNYYLCHHGVVGMKWGVRRYQNKDGSLTAEGRRHLGQGEGKDSTASKIAAKVSSTASKVASSVGKKVSDTVKNVRVKRAAAKERKKEIKENKKNDNRARKNPLGMTDEELKKTIDRMKLEDAYRELERKSHPGREYWLNTAQEVGRKILTDPQTYVNAAKGLDWLVHRTTPEIGLEREKRQTIMLTGQSSDGQKKKKKGDN